MKLKKSQVGKKECEDNILKKKIKGDVSLEGIIWRRKKEIKINK